MANVKERNDYHIFDIFHWHYASTSNPEELSTDFEKLG